MYSLVVLMALGTAGEAPDWGCGYGGYGGGYGGYCGGYGGYCGGYGGGYGGGYCGGYGGGYGGYCGGYGGGWGGCGYSSCYSYGSCYAPVYSYCAPVCYPSHIMPVTPKKEDKGKKGDEVSTQATIVVNLPADAKLTFDGAATNQTSSHRVFVTPELKPGVEYTYVVKAQMMQDGKPVTAEKKVSFKAGETTEVTLGEPASGVASR